MGKTKVEAGLTNDANIFKVEATPDGKYRDTFVEWAVANDVGNARALAEEADARDVEMKELRELQGREFDEQFTSKNNILPRDILKNRTAVVKRLRDAGFDGLLQDGELVVYNTDKLQTKAPTNIRMEQS